MRQMDKTEIKTGKSRRGWLALLWPVSGIILGALGGYIYYIKIGCHSGTCPITSNPVFSMLWGAILGFLIFDMFRKKPAKPEQKKPETES
jgi:hypothetical protein